MATKMGWMNFQEMGVSLPGYAPERLELARVPTPFLRLERTSKELGVDFWIKRDDMTGAELMGNKVRKLEFLLAEAKTLGATVLLTCGGEQSNHCRATAMAGTRLGIRSVLFLRTQDPKSPPATSGNILLDRLANAELRWISHSEYAERKAVMAAAAEQLTKQGEVPYVIPEGGSNALGAWGYVGFCHELARDFEVERLERKSTSLVYACGSGGTAAGMQIGLLTSGLADLGVTATGINVCDNRDYFVRVISEICNEFKVLWKKSPTVETSSIDILDGYVGLGYAKATPEEIAAQVAFTRREGVVLDPVYTGKAFYGLVSELKKNRQRFGERIIFCHTGGMFGVFAQPDLYASAMSK